MVNLKSQRRLAAEILKAGQNRVWINPDQIEDVEAAITREEIRKLINEGVITKLPEKGVSHGRARILHEKRRKGRRRGVGSRSGSARARQSKKEIWMRKIRALRKKLRELKTHKNITESTYRQIYSVANSGRFDSITDLENYLKTHELWRKR
jgi:large subunit ribosomal protein L19e